MDAYKHGISQTFSPETSCPIATGYNSDKQCCGDHPNRFPYKSVGVNGDQRRCCGSITYNPLLLDCCSNNEIQAVGTC